MSISVDNVCLFVDNRVDPLSAWELKLSVREIHMSGHTHMEQLRSIT